MASIGAEQGRPQRHAWLPTFPSFVWIFFTIVVCFVVMGLDAVVSRDGDPALHVALGQLMLEQGGLLRTDPTCLGAPDKPFIAHEWLAQIGFALAHSALGLAGPALLAAFLYAGCLALLTWWLVRTETAVPWVTAAVILASLFLGGRILARPHVFTWLAALAWTLALEHWRRGRWGPGRLAVVGIPLVALWANLHGGFLVAFVLLAVYGLGDAVDRRRATSRAKGSLALFATVGVGVVVASLANPFGWRLHAHLVSFLLHPVLGRASMEFQPLELASVAGGVFLAYAALTGFVLLRRRGRLSAVHLILWIVFVAMTLRSSRHVALFVLLVPVTAFAGAWRPRRPDATLDGRPLVALVLTLVVVLVGVLRAPPVRLDPARMPVRALEHVRIHPARFQGPVFCDTAWGGYLVFELYPPQRVFSHSLNDHYGAEHVVRHLTVWHAREGWREILDTFDVRWVLVSPKAPLGDTLGKDAGWVRAYADEVAVLFHRAGG